jgi:hypothetical protein
MIPCLEEFKRIIRQFNNVPYLIRKIEQYQTFFFESSIAF